MNPIRSLRKYQVRKRAHYRCEYCLTHEVLGGTDFTEDHIIPQVLGGSNELNNLCWCCFYCNIYKGTSLTAIAPETNERVSIFDPRHQKWEGHFGWSADGTRILGKTPTGRATVESLRLNRERLVAARRFWVKHHVHPPKVMSP